MSAQSLFVIQSDLISAKVDVAVSQAIKEVVQQIIELRQDVSGLRQELHKEVGSLRQELHKEISGLRHELKDEMNIRFSSLEKDMAAVKTRLGMRDQTLNQVRGHFIDYSFKASWLVTMAILSGVVSFLVGRIAI